MLIDTHCHLTEEKFESDLSEVIERATAVGVEKIIVPATSIEDSVRVDALAKKFAGVYGLVGVHPENIQVITDELRRLISNNPKIVGIGEIGLDFYWDKEKKTKKEQVEIFTSQMQLAVELHLPVAIHSRGSEAEIREVFEQMEELPEGQFHCFGESKEFLGYVLDKGFYVSFCGNVTYPSTSSGQANLRELAKMVPENRLLTETDAPYLSPEPYRGERNEPKNVKITADFLASLRGVTPEELYRATTANASRLFNLPNV